MTIRDAAYLLYLGFSAAAVGVIVLYTVSPEFRVFADEQSRQLNYRIRLWDYNRKHKPVPQWVTKLAAPGDDEPPPA